MAKALDLYTLKCVALRLRRRASRLRRGIQWDVTWARAAEADLWADKLRYLTRKRKK